MQDRIKLLKVRNFSAVIDDAIVFIRAYFRPIGYTVLVLVIPVLVLSSLCYIAYISDLGHSIGRFGVSSIGGYSAGSIFGMIFLLLGHSLVTLVVIGVLTLSEQSDADAMQVKDVLHTVRRNFFRLFWFSVLIFILAFLVVFFFAIIIEALSSVFGGGLSVVLTLILCVFVLYLYIATSFIPIIYLRERCLLNEAISRSFFLVKRNWWWTFVIFIVSLTIGVVASTVFTLPYYGYVFVRRFLLHGYEYGIVDKIEIVIKSCSNVLVTVFYSFAMYMQYYSLVEKKEGEDIMRQIEEIGAEETNPN